MPRFSQRDLLPAMGLIAAGVACLVALFSFEPPWNDVKGYAAVVLWLVAGGFIGAGLLAPFKRPITGAVIGVLIQLLLGSLFLVQVAAFA